MRMTLVWLLVCGVLLGSVAAILSWVSGESLPTFLRRALDKNFVLGVITTLAAVVAFLAAVMLGSKP